MLYQSPEFKVFWDACKGLAEQIEKAKAGADRRPIAEQLWELGQFLAQMGASRRQARNEPLPFRSRHDKCT